MKSKIPALCLSGGKLSEYGGKAVEYRVWVHPQEGDDYFFRSKNIEKNLAKKGGITSRTEYCPY